MTLGCLVLAGVPACSGSDERSQRSSGGDFDNPTAPGSEPSGAGSGGGDGDGGDGDGDCPDTTVRATQVKPTVILVVDQSSSMDDPFEGRRSRWNVLRDFLLDEPNGLVADLQDQVRFGLALYSAESGGNAPDPIGECPMITTVAPSLNNYDAIAQTYRGVDTIEDTPTGDAIDAIIEDLDLGTDPDATEDPTVLIVATDGEPDRCEELDPQNGQQEAIDAVDRAFALGIRTFIISVGQGSVSAEHQQDVANAGLGRGDGDPDAPYWVAGDDRSLRAALSEIVGTQLGCEVQLNGRVSGDACLGAVTLNGRALGCGDRDGWELSSPRTVRLLGDACDELKSGGDTLLDVTFPCGVDVELQPVD